MKRSSSNLMVLPLILTGLFLILPACLAQDPVTCQDVEDQQPLRKVPELAAAAGAAELSTTFDLQIKTLCVPTTTQVGTRDDDNGQTIMIYQAVPLELRTYVYPDPNTGNPTWGYKDPNTGDIMASPGPTLRVRKANEDGKGGQGLAVLLKNNLPVNTAGCNSACPSTITCPIQSDGTCAADFLDPLVTACQTGTPPTNCCCVIDCTQREPNCYHGDNTTNLHFHGSHASPQAPQDFVLLELHPEGDKSAGITHAAHGERATVAYGQYQYRVDPFRWTQPEGSHWYHPHKHGSVALQVANGLPGALIIDGDFDDWLDDQYGGKLEEKVLVLQQIQLAPNLFTNTPAAPQTLVNGQINPTVSIKPGEVQRWRFVNATMSAGTQLAVYFPTGTIVRQIAMDGVRFSPLNYLCQPLYNPVPDYPCNLTPVTTPSITLSPGNRADFLVQAPMYEGMLRVERKVTSNMTGPNALRRLRAEAAMAPGAAEPSLVTLFVDDGDGKIAKRETAAPPMESKMLAMEKWPAMPTYLQNITDAEVADNPVVDLTFEQTVLDTMEAGPVGSAVTKFKINNTQYSSKCVNVTTRLDVAQQWEVSNTTALGHPFHIHTNPFQLYATNGTRTLPEPVWMDTIGLPTGSQAAPGAVTLRQRYEEFTGEYVLHCHFLGHEDRGMMFGVQTVCKDKPNNYGVPSTTVPECTGALEDAADRCD